MRQLLVGDEIFLVVVIIIVGGPFRVSGVRAPQLRKVA